MEERKIRLRGMNTSREMNTRRIGLVEVGPRDGLQNEQASVSTADKIALILRALDAGVTRIETASFVNPKRVPQMADAEAVMAQLPSDAARYIGLVLNMQGAERALKTNIHELGAVCAASDAFGMRNQGRNAEESLNEAMDIVRLAHEAGRKGHITISVAFGCPFEGEIPEDRILSMAKRAASCEPSEIALADTIGVAVPPDVMRLVHSVAKAIAPIPVRGHFHNTRNTGLANVWAAVEAGAASIDASLGGMGGCPFAPKATGNVPTEDVAYLLERAGVETGLDLAKLIAASHWMGEILGRALPGMVSRAGNFPARAS